MKQLLFTLALAVAAIAFWLRAIGPATAAHPAASAWSAPPTVVISMLYSPDQQAWLEWARDQYVRQRPFVQVKLEPAVDGFGVDAISSGKKKPVVWSPESRLELNDAARRWFERTGRPLYDGRPELVPPSLLESVIVLITWRSRAKVLDDHVRREGDSSRLWKRLLEATASPDGWNSLGGPKEWGSVKLGYTDPGRTGSGLWTLYLACLDESGSAGELSLAHLEDPAVRGLLRRAAASPRTSLTNARELVKRMEQFGPSRYDLVVAPEKLALEALGTPKERWERLVIYYPPTLASSDHPAAVLDLDETSDEQKAAAREWIAFLRSRPVQIEAIAHGFRPADGSIRLSEGPRPSAFADPLRPMNESLAVVRHPAGPVVERLLTIVRSETNRPDPERASYIMSPH